MDFQYASFEFSCRTVLVDRYGHSDDCVVGGEFSVPVLGSEIMERDPFSRLCINLNRILGRKF
jgi:hypothetical protein